MAVFSDLTLKVFGVDRREVATLNKYELISEGTKEVYFNGITLASGLCSILSRQVISKKKRK